jgi:hypothetical protein
MPSVVTREVEEANWNPKFFATIALYNHFYYNTQNSITFHAVSLNKIFCAVYFSYLN